MIWQELEAARSAAGVELGIRILPLPVGDRGERDLADLFTAARERGADAVETLVCQARHAIAMAKAETVSGEKSPEWFTGAVFSTDNFRRLVSKQPKIGKRKPAASAPATSPVFMATDDDRAAAAAELAAFLGKETA